MFMYPIFLTDDPTAETEIASLPGQKRWGIDKLEAFVAPLVAKGLRSVILFGVPLDAPKDMRGSPADDPNGPVILGIKLLRRCFPDLVVAVDVCLCALCRLKLADDPAANMCGPAIVRHADRCRPITAIADCSTRTARSDKPSRSSASPRSRSTTPAPALRSSLRRT